MKQLNKFIPLVKIDVAKRLVYGVATAELPDQSGEICDYESTVPYYKAWSERFEKATDGKSLGNLRAMHTNIAAGKLVSIEFNDAQKQIEIVGKVVDDDEWQKVQEGVYTGFSQGGRYAKTWEDPDNKKLTRYTADPSEVSLVDNPCLLHATFTAVKADGATEMRKFKTQETPMTETVNDGKPVQPAFKPIQKWEASDGKTFEKKEEWRVYELSLETKAAMNAVTAPALNALAELEKAVSEMEQPESGSPEDPMTLAKRDFSDEERKKLAESGAAMSDGSFPIENTQDLKNAIHAFGRAADKEKAKAHIIARAKALGEEKMLPEGWGGNENKDDNGAEKSVMPKIKKGMQEIARTACMIEEMNWLANNLTWEAASEGDNSPQPNRFKQIITEMCSFLEALVEEECRELATPHAVELMGAETMEMAAGLPKDTAASMVKFISKAIPAKPDDKLIELMAAITKAATAEPDMSKAGARHSAADKAHLAKAMTSIDEASDHLDDAKKQHANVAKAHDGMRKCMGAMADCMKSLKSGDLSKLDAEALEKYRKEATEGSGNMSDHLDDMENHLDKADKHHGKMAKSHDGIEAAHDAAHHALKAVGAEPADDDDASKAAQAEMKKAADELTLVKADLTAKESENAELKKALDTINGQVPSLIERIKKLEAQPMPPKGAVFPVTKGHEAKAEPAAPVEAPSHSTYGASPAEMREIMNIHP